MKNVLVGVLIMGSFLFGVNYYSIVVLQNEYYSNLAQVSSVLNQGDGLRGEYYNGKNFETLFMSRTDTTINFNWGERRPIASEEMQRDNFSVRWSGYVEPKYSEEYTFHTQSDDGIRLWIDDQLIIDHWVNNSFLEKSGKKQLIAGKKYPIKVEYYENGFDAAAKLSWSSPSQEKQVLPQSQLYTILPIVTKSEPTNDDEQPVPVEDNPSFESTTPEPTPEPTKPTSKFILGDSVQVTSNSVRVRESANGRVLGKQQSGATGQIVGGPTPKGDTTWWSVNYTSGTDGWTAEELLIKTNGTPTPTPSPTVTLSASPTSITIGQSSTLTWSSTNATSCTAIGNWTGSKGTAGTQTVSPTSNATYTLSCTGAGGTTVQSANIIVSAITVPPSTKFIIGDSIQTTSAINVRGTANGTLLGTQASGSTGTVTAGPVYTGGYHWWNIDYTSGIDGWSAEDYLIKGTVVVTPTPITPPTGPQVLLYSTLNNLSSITNPLVGIGVGASVLSSPTNDFVSAKFNDGIRLDSPLEYVRFPQSNGTKQNVELDQGTVDMWFQPFYDHDDNNKYRIFGNGKWGSHGVFGVGKHNSSNYNAFYIHRFDANGNLDAINTIPANKYSWKAGEWVNLRITWDWKAAPGVQNLHVYFNGIEAALEGDNGKPVTTGTWSTGTESASNHVYIGSVGPSTNSSGISNNGVFDEIKIWDTVVPPTPSTTTPSPSTKFIIGDSIQTTSAINVRGTANGTLLGTQASGSTGTVTAGPVYTGGYHWWNIDYTSGIDGWSAEDYLIKGTVVIAPPPTPTPPVNFTGDLVVFPSPEVEFIIGPQMKANSASIPWPWYDQTMIAKGVIHGNNFPATPQLEPIDNNAYQNRNYYDLGLTLYTAYYRTGDIQFLTLARKVTDSWWQHSAIGNGTTAPDSSMAPRSIALGGLMLRALDGRPEMWPWIEKYVRHHHWIWLERHLTRSTLWYGTRDGGYMLNYAAILSQVSPSQAVRAEFKAKSLSSAKDYYARLQNNDGGWYWLIDTDYNTNTPDVNASQPFQVGLMLEGMIRVHQITGDSTIKQSIIKAADWMYTKSYETQPVTNLTNVLWRAMRYFTLESNYTSNNRTTGFLYGSPYQGVIDARELNATSVHTFGYAYKLTGDPKYKTWGDDVFSATFGKGQGPGADAYSGLADFREKEYNQNFRSSGHYLAWRLGF